jgi:hypothetical protein
MLLTEALGRSIRHYHAAIVTTPARPWLVTVNTRKEMQSGWDLGYASTERR